MIKTVAVLIRKGSLSVGLQDDTRVNLLRLKDDEVVGIESITLENSSENYFSLLMKIKNVSLVYANWISNNLTRLLGGIGISIKCGKEVSEDKLIDQFILD